MFETNGSRPRQDLAEEFGSRQRLTAPRSRVVRTRPRPRPRPRPDHRPRRRGARQIIEWRDGDLPEAGSEYVRWVQSALNQAMGLRLQVDGVMSRETRSAVRSFQQRQGLPADGIVGPDTERALMAARGAPPLESQAAEAGELEWEGEVNRSSADYVRWVQQSLNQIMGLRLAVDGINGPMTNSAIRNFQQRQGLTADGIVGPQTEAALITAGASRPPVAGVSTAWGSYGSSPSSSAGPVPSGCPDTRNLNCKVLDRFVIGKDYVEPAALSAHQRKITQLAKDILDSQSTSRPVRSVLVVGHTDPTGTSGYNEALGGKRAGEVSDDLSEAMETWQPGSLTLVNWDVRSCGEESTQSVGDHAKLRRVEVCPIPDPVPRLFETGGTPPMQPVRSGNQVLPLIDGAQTFKEMVRAIKTAKTFGHYIYLLGWWMSDNFELIPGDPNSTISKLFINASTRGVQVRAMLWDQWIPPLQNQTEVDHINQGLSNGAAINDSRVLYPYSGGGSHHQKLLVVKGDEGLIGFCGGIDINPDRIRTVGSDGSPYNDVHCRIKGPAAYDLLRVFLDRWQDHPEHGARERGKGGALLGLSEPMPAPEGDMLVQIGRTYGNGMRHRGVPGGYQFARNGEQTCRRMIVKAIREARQFIYIEDQYLVSMEMSQALQSALPNIQHLTILIPHDGVTAMAGQTSYRRQLFLTPLMRAGGGKVRVFFLGPPGAPGTYVHSKMTVVDDTFAVIGSANLNRRSLTHDSEVTAGIYDPSSNSLIKQLRIALWAKHLNMNTPAGLAALANGVASAQLWLAPPAGSRVTPYIVNTNAGPQNRVEAAAWDQAWNSIDPVGT